MQEPTLPSGIHNVVLMFFAFVDDFTYDEYICESRDQAIIANEACQLFLDNPQYTSIELVGLRMPKFTEERYHTWNWIESKPWWIGYQEVLGGPIVKYDRFQFKDDCKKLYKDLQRQDVLCTSNSMGATEVITDMPV